MSYTLDEQNLERQHLLARVLEPFTKRLLDALRLRPDSRCLDVGCGIGETTRLIARYLGPQGECTGIDQDGALIGVAQAGPCTGARLSFRVGDATKLPFEDGAFDFVFTRYLLVHVQEPLTVLRDMIRVARSGAVVAAQEGDFMFQQCCYPESWAYKRLNDIWGGLFANAMVGRKLVALFRDAGCSLVGTMADIYMEPGNAGLKQLYRMTIEAAGPALLRKGVLNESDFDSLRQEFSRVETDASVVCIGNPVIQFGTLFETHETVTV
jgi:SAM-dependent methyltransferase